MKSLRKTVALMHKAIVEYKMIKEGDKICVGLSGGKDSLMLLTCLAEYQKRCTQKFELCAVFVDIFSNSNCTYLENYCNKINVPFYVERSNIIHVVFEVRKEKNPCSLCANLRRGLLNSTAKKLGCNKVALGHHADDFLQTFFISASKENRLSCFWPLTYLSRTNLFVIRPLLYVWEDMILANSEGFPILKNNCPANKNSERENIKIIINELNNKIPNFKKNLFESLCHTERYNLFDKSKKLIEQ